MVNRWRILDNLRRSLVPGGLAVAAAVRLADLGGAGRLEPGGGAGRRDPRGSRRCWTGWRGTSRAPCSGWQGAADELVRAVVMIAFLPHQAWLAVDAIVRVFYRRCISRRNLLEWQTAESAGAQADRHAGRDIRGRCSSSSRRSPCC